MKWAILAVVVILTAPNVLGRFEHDTAPVRRGFIRRSIRRYGLAPVMAALMLGAAGLLAAWLVIRHW